MKRLLAGAALLSVCAALAADGPVVIRDVRVFDGVRMLPATSVAIADGKIAAVGRSVPRGARVVSGKGKTLLPGLIDAHVHVRTVEDLETAARFGVTTSLDMFTDLRVRRSDWRSAGFPATAPGGHGTEYGVPIPTLERAEEARAFVDARIAAGSDYLKIMKDDGSAFGFRRPTLDAATLGALVAAAHARGKLAIVHIATASDAREALAAGADGIAHVYLGSSDAEIVRMAKLAFWTPTLAVILQGKREGPALEVVRVLHEGGVRILAGTDAPNPGTEYGKTLHEEMELLVEAGLTPLEALGAATSASAAAYGLRDRGRVAAGMRADLVLVEGDPSVDIRDTRRVVAVWKEGKVKIRQ